MTVTAPTTTVPTMWMFVPGKAAPQGSKNAYPNGRGGYNLVESSRSLHEWRDKITLEAVRHARRHHWQIPDPRIPLSTLLLFRMPRPPHSKLDTPTSRPDLDKLTRAVHDALTDAHIWHDDAQVTQSSQHKIWAMRGQDPGLIIVVGPDTDTTRDQEPVA